MLSAGMEASSQWSKRMIGLSPCADCSEFACSKLEGFFKAVPAARDDLLALRAK
jgi:hypothetical protein